MTLRSVNAMLRFAVVTLTCSLMLMVVAFVTGSLQFGSTPVNAKNTTYNSTIIIFGSHRKLLQEQAAQAKPDRYWGDTCSTSDISITQGQTAPLPSGIPTYTVQIMNICSTGCDISGIHVSCGWFSSARTINPILFKRLSFNDCLVNNGNTLLNAHTISFQYANTYPYPLSVSSVTC